MVSLKIFALPSLILITVFLILDGISIYIAVRNAYKAKAPYKKTLTTEFIGIFLWGIFLAILIYL